ncbi:MAG: aspartate aminotransferase family protein [Chloroflexi bacterium]|nr:aspartate aminotransferase family protein [Chloroflexota bacterium]
MDQAKLQREVDRYQARTPKSRQLQDEASKYLPGGSTRGAQYFDPYPIFVDRGEGHYVYDVDGNGYLDFMINATSLIMGHAHPDVVSALQEQAEKGTAFSGPTEAMISLSKLLCDRIPSVDTIRFTNSGTEGTMMAIRAARAFTGRPKIAKFEGGYHGSHESVSVSVGPAADKLDPNGPSAIPEYPGQPQGILDDVVVMPYNDLETSERLIRQHKDELACVIMEAIASGFGYTPAEPEFLLGIREVTRELGILLIFDEVQSFRVAPGGAQELFGVIPDLTAMGKIIGGGMAVGAFGGREDVMSLFDPTGGGAALGHSGTFNANPMTVVAGEVTMKHLTPEVYARLSRLGDTLREKLRAVFAEFEVPAQITGVASLFGIHFTSDEITDYRSVLRGDAHMKKALFTGLLNEDVLLMGGSSGALNTLTTESDVDTLVDTTRQVIQRIR